MLLSLNAPFSVFWSVNCTQTLGGTAANCSESQTFVNDYFDEGMYLNSSPNTTYVTTESFNGY